MPSISSTTAARWTASTSAPAGRLGYYTASELPFYYSLLESSALCANYFCSLLGPTWPNRFYLMSGTSGGITTNGLWGYGIFDSGRWPIILDLLDEAGVTWKIYNLGGIDDVPERRERQRRRVLEPLGPRPAHHSARRTTTSATAAPASCRRFRG